MKKWIMRLAFVALMFTLCNVVKAQNRSAEYQRLLNEAIELEHTSDMLYKMLVPAFEKNLVATGAISSAANQQMSEELANAMAPVVDALIKELWSKTFTLEEMRQIVDWLSTTTGQKMLMLTPEVSSYTEKVMQEPANQTLIQNIVMKYVGQ